MSTDHAGDDLVAQNRALGGKTRFAIFRYLEEAPGPVGVAELTDHLGLNHNAIRQHLAKLRDAGLVLEERAAASGPGRPPLRYRVAPGCSARSLGEGPYEVLAMGLIEVLGGRTAREVGFEAGVRLAERARSSWSTEDPLTVLEAVARRQGFEPSVEAATARGTGDGEAAEAIDLVLHACPLAEAALGAPEVVCEMHRGLAEGIASVGDDRLQVTGLVVRPPKRAGCRVQLQRAAR